MGPTKDGFLAIAYSYHPTDQESSRWGALGKREKRRSKVTLFHEQAWLPLETPSEFLN